MKTYLDGLVRDFRYALRDVGKNRRFSLIPICALALGIGASTVVFSVVYNVFFQALPYRNFNRSVVFEIRNTADAGASKGRSYCPVDGPDRLPPTRPSRRPNRSFSRSPSRMILRGQILLLRSKLS